MFETISACFVHELLTFLQFGFVNSQNKQMKTGNQSFPLVEFLLGDHENGWNEWYFFLLCKNNFQQSKGTFNVYLASELNIFLKFFGNLPGWELAKVWLCVTSLIYLDVDTVLNFFTEGGHLLLTIVVEDTGHVPDPDPTHLVAIKA